MLRSEASVEGPLHAYLAIPTQFFPDVLVLLITFVEETEIPQERPGDGLHLTAASAAHMPGLVITFGSSSSHRRRRSSTVRTRPY
ncbi:hypothetical protein [Microtetraspora glauca]|uniref:Uncharacterized protein n=1 Tax=Microtetraspora glauca TaxID=1996 RepID=A0ABV3GHB6_MICGL